MLLGAPCTAAFAQEPKTSGSPDAVSAAPRIAFNDVLAMQRQPIDGREDEDAGGDVSQDGNQIGAIVIRGNQAIAEDRYQAAVEPFFGQELTDDVIERLTDQLVQIAKEQGYSYARVEIDSTAAELGIVQAAIDEGRIDAVEIEGSDNALARRILDQLVGRPANRGELERALLLVTDMPALSFKAARFKREGDGAAKRGILVVELIERDPAFRVEADNYGSKNFGPVRARVSARTTDVLNAGDELRGSIRANPLEPDELVFASAVYASQIGTGGAVVSIDGSLGHTSPGEIQGAGDITGDTVRAGASLSVPVKRTRDASAWVEAGLGYISISQDSAGDLLRDDTVVTASVGLRTRFALAGGTASTGVTIERGLGILGATRLGDPLASRRDGDGVFTKVRFSADYRLSLAKRLSVYLATAGQIADRPLLGSEEIALGGPYRGRGYNFAEVLGDEGIFGLAELRYDVPTGKLPLRYLRLYGFIDGGYVSDIDLTGGEGSLFSAGPGLRTRLGPIDLELEGGFPLGGSGERTVNPKPQVNVRAGLNF